MREFRGWVKLILFLSSYIPLFLILSLEIGSYRPRAIDGLTFPMTSFRLNFSYYSLAIIAGCIILTWLLYQMVSVSADRGRTQKAVDKFQQRNELLSTYLLVYVFVFVGLDFTKLLDVGIFIIFFAILGVLQIYSEMLHVNPMLGIRGYRIYEITSDSEVLLVISETKIEEKVISMDADTSSEQRQKIELVHLGSMAYLAP